MGIAGAPGAEAAHRVGGSDANTGTGDVLVARDRDVLRITVNRPEKRNPLSRAVLSGIRATLEAHRDDDVLRLVTITGAGERSFAAGGDLREVEAIRTAEEAARFSDEACAALDAVRRFPAPVVAVLNGDALGGGAELAVACDLRIMAAHARIGFIQGRLNISTSWGGGTDLMRLVGYGRALSLLGRSTILTAPEALDVGLVEAVAPTGTDVQAFADEFTEPMRQQTALVLRAFKAQAVSERFAAPRTESRLAERSFFERTWVHDDHWAAAARALAPAR